MTTGLTRKQISMLYYASASSFRVQIRATPCHLGSPPPPRRGNKFFLASSLVRHSPPPTRRRLEPQQWRKLEDQAWPAGASRSGPPRRRSPTPPSEVESVQTLSLVDPRLPQRAIRFQIRYRLEFGIGRFVVIAQGALANEGWRNLEALQWTGGWRLTLGIVAEPKTGFWSGFDPHSPSRGYIFLHFVLTALKLAGVLL